MEQHLPKESGKYLKLILGNVNVSILDQKTRYDYKDQYEQFKLILNIIGMCVFKVNFVFFIYKVPKKGTLRIFKLLRNFDDTCTIIFLKFT